MNQENSRSKIQDCISFEDAMAVVVEQKNQIFQSTDPFSRMLIEAILKQFEPLYKEFYDLGVRHGRNTEPAPDAGQDI